MLRSMTAFARIESQHEPGGIQWEIRSVNHRYLDVNLRLPEDLRRLDPKVRERIGARLNRGKVDCTLRVLANPAATGGLAVDGDLAARVAQAARAVAELLPDAAPVNPVDILRWPGVVQAPAPDPELIERLVLGELDRALADLVGMREREGARIEAVIRDRLDELETEVSRVRERPPRHRAGVRRAHAHAARRGRHHPRRRPHGAGARPQSRSAWTWPKSSIGSKRTSTRSAPPSNGPSPPDGASTSSCRS